jgi:hypothetical protein
MRRLPGPAANRPGDGGNSRGSLRIVSGLAENTNLEPVTKPSLKIRGGYLSDLPVVRAIDGF